MTKLFGTNGIRGIVNTEMTCELALGIGKAWGTYLKRSYPHPSVVIGADTRLSNDMLKNSISAGFFATGCNVTDIGLVPTPSLQFFTKENQYHSGVMITASHNPPEFNGIKGIHSDGTEFNKNTEETIEQIFFSRDFKVASWDQVGSADTWPYANELYMDGILSTVDIEEIKRHHFHVVLDCGNGAGSVITPILLEKLGCTVISLNCMPDGHFPGRHSEPIRENITELIDTVKETNADFGVAQDGDADRAIFIDGQGEYIWGDQTLALFAKYLTQKTTNSIVVTPVTSSTSVDDVVNKNEGTVIRTQVGSPIVARMMKKTNAVFGGEENGGLIFPELQFCRDSAMTIAKLLELLSQKQQTLSELLFKIPKYAMIKTKLQCQQSLKQLLMKTINDVIQNDERIKTIDRTDGLKLFYPTGWVLMRPSGTEPIFRIYTESKKQSDAIELSDRFVNLVVHYRELLEKK